MNALLDDDFNPRFVRFTRVTSPAADVTRLVDDTIAEYAGPDANVVRDLEIEQLHPLAAGAVRVDLWVDHLDDHECVYGFLCSSADGNVPYARGSRTITKLGHWSDQFLRKQSVLRKDLPAFA